MLSLYARTWPSVGRWLGRGGEQAAHERMIELLRRSDGIGPLVAIARAVGRATLPDRLTTVGGVTIPTPLILAAGFVKGDGFGTEADALVAAAQGRDLLPGWRVMPALVGAVELGSYTRQPRLGNSGPVVWRDDAARSTHNRVGLRNPGAAAAAAFLGARRGQLPGVWGVSLAVSPGIDDPDESATQLREAATSFGRAFAGGAASSRHAADATSRPAWYTLNLSCPNTDDDPAGLQTATLARQLASAVAEVVSAPLWVKVGPGLSATQYDVLVDVLSDVGARAVVATNTLARPAPIGSMTAGMGGAPLREHALAAMGHLGDAIARRGSGLDIVGSGGILDGRDLRAYLDAGAKAAMVYSAIVFRGPLAPALILREAGRQP